MSVPSILANRPTSITEEANELLNLQRAQIKKYAVDLFTRLPWLLYILRMGRDNAGGWGALFIVILKTAIPGGILGMLSRIPQRLSDKLIKACELRSPTLLSETVFRVIKSATACGLFVVGTSFAVNAHQKATSAFNRQLIFGVYGMFARCLTSPKKDQSLSIYSLFPKAETVTLENECLHPMASVVRFICGLWTLTSWKGSPILATAGGNALSTLVNICCKSFDEEPALV